MLAKLGTSPSYFLQPVRIIRAYHLSNLRLDLVAGLTVAVVLIPQAIAYAFIAELPAAISPLVFSALVITATEGILVHFPELNKAATALGLGTILLIVLLRRAFDEVKL